MVFYLVGLGLGGPKDVTVKGLEVIKSASRIYLEAYTSILSCGKDELEAFYGKPVTLADRDMVEQDSETLLADAKELDVAFLVIGDPFGATTHSDLILRAVDKNIPYKVVHNASIMNAIGCCGLQLYNFGETVSIVFWTDTWKPDSFYDKIESNLQRGLHTLCLLDIKVKEQSIENLMRGRKVYEPPRYMTANTACKQLLQVIDNKALNNIKTKLQPDSMCVALSRIGWDNQKIVASKLKDLVNCDIGPPLHSLVIAGEMHPLEEDFLAQFKLVAENSE
uniref:diphthine methyl ester synthase n=1 Tax=Phallusia mammillata TaxID=59560 RepID=A0A6F9DC42_9ASCI|nr:diphthine synthase-like [Phallusia mammillata]